VVPVKPFDAPRKSLGGLDAEAAGKLIAAAADVALIIDGEGVIRDVALGSEELSKEGYSRWLGKPWVDTVTSETRAKIAQLIRDASEEGIPRWRHVNHPSSRGGDIPVAYSAMQLGRSGKIVAVGREMRSVAALQQRLVNAQQSMERDYWRLRQVETRYRLLFQMASEAVLIVDTASLKVLEANPAAAQLLGDNVARIVGHSFPEGFDEQSTAAVQNLLEGVRTLGFADPVRARMAAGGREFLVAASQFRQDSASLLLIRLSAPAVEEEAGAGKSRAALLQAVEHAPDGFVMTDKDGRITSANAAFLELAQLSTESQARGESLDRWLGRPGVDLSVLTANLRQYGSLRLFATTLRGEYGLVVEVEISAVSVSESERVSLGFIIRNVGRRLSSASPVGEQALRSVEQITEQVGRVPLKDLVRQSSDVIERLCIEAALKLTGDNRASAAEMLGLSRQSLYVKLRRHGIGELG
jgi:transcriptional regulator PpsR